MANSSAVTGRIYSKFGVDSRSFEQPTQCGRACQKHSGPRRRNWPGAMESKRRLARWMWIGQACAIGQIVSNQPGNHSMQTTNATRDQKEH